MKLALMLGGMAAGRRAGGPGELLKGGTKLLNSSPELARLTDVVRGRLLEAGKGAALAVATRQVESLTDRVGKRVESLGDLGAPRPGQSADQPAAEDVTDGTADAVEDRGDVDEVPADAEPAPESADADADADEGDEGDEGDEERDEEPAPARPPSRAPAAKESGRGKNTSTTATVRRTASGGGTRASGTTGKAAAGRKPGRTTRARRGEGNG